MNRQKGHHYDEDMSSSSSSSSSKVIVVAVKASKDISRTALVWALTHVVQPGDCIKLLVIIPALSSRKKVWGFSRFTTDCATNHWTSRLGTVSDQKEDITNSCSQLVLQLHDFYDPEKIKIRVKILSGSSCGAVAAEAKRVQSSWVILDRKLKGEKKYCMDELHCNIVIMKHSHPKILRLNLNSSPKKELGRDCTFLLEPNAYTRSLKDNFEHSDIIKGPSVTPASSPEQGSPPLTVTTDIGTASISSSDPGTSPFFHSDNYERRRRCFPFVVHEGLTNLEDIVSDSESEKLSSSSKSSSFQPWISNMICVDGEFSKHEENIKRSSDKSLVSTYESLLQKLTMLDQDHIYGKPTCKIDVNLSKSVREAISLARNAPHGPPPLCSICQHKAPAFGNPPRWFTFAELQLATGGFSQANFLAEGGFGSVHRGVLPDGQVVAVKQYKLASTQGDKEFCSEVEVLSCAQHRNVVMLTGFCVEDGRRLLVYEYICNGSLDSHLYGRMQNVLDWSARQKIAVGAARGLRYLHEECRVGCIVHRDLRPNNILLTHDFEALVGDFGLARWQPDGDMGVESIPSISVEIKPKCGFLPLSTFISEGTAIKKRVTRFEMHQALKLQRGEISQQSVYDPLDLYSGSKERIHKAVKDLFTTPQNNFRVFLNGSLILGGLGGGAKSTDACIAKVLEDELHSVIQADDGQCTENLFTLVTEAVHKSGVLDKLVEVQKLDSIDVEGVIHAYYDSTSQQCKVCRELSEEQAKKYTSLHSVSLDESLRIVKDYLIAATAKDCSLMLCFRPRQEKESGSAYNSIYLESTKQAFDYKVHFIDLDLKRLSKVEDYYELDKKIVSCYKQMIKTDNGRNEDAN